MLTGRRALSAQWERNTMSFVMVPMAEEVAAKRINLKALFYTACILLAAIALFATAAHFGLVR